MEGGEAVWSRFQDGLLEESGMRGGNLFHKVEDFESSRVVLVADGREERGVAFPITPAQLGKI